jgi:hypothetical protein
LIFGVLPGYEGMHRIAFRFSALVGRDVWILIY